MENGAEEREFEIFKSVMDAANADRETLSVEIDRLKGLLEGAVRDIVALQAQCGQYKAELDLRRGLGD